MSDALLVAALRLACDKLVVAIADVERGDHLRAADALDAACRALDGALSELKAAAA